mmetsp:Transcript_26516/g.63024  ORF Transcript_26516/g.63024 Transcript_26516/m.63024 type:complete len:239 (+) Transcript_26516:262-978(+)
MESRMLSRSWLVLVSTRRMAPRRASIASPSDITCERRASALVSAMESACSSSAVTRVANTCCSSNKLPPISNVPLPSVFFLRSSMRLFSFFSLLADCDSTVSTSPACAAPSVAATSCFSALTVSVVSATVAARSLRTSAIAPQSSVQHPSSFSLSSAEAAAMLDETVPSRTVSLAAKVSSALSNASMFSVRTALTLPRTASTASRNSSECSFTAVVHVSSTPASLFVTSLTAFSIVPS